LIHLHVRSALRCWLSPPEAETATDVEPRTSSALHCYLFRVWVVILGARFAHSTHRRCSARATCPRQCDVALAIQGLCPAQRPAIRAIRWRHKRPDAHEGTQEHEAHNQQLQRVGGRRLRSKQ